MLVRGIELKGSKLMTLKNSSDGRKIRIAFVDVQYNSFYGAQQSMHTLATHLDKSSFEPIFVTTEEGVLSEQFRASGIPTQILPISPLVNVFGHKVVQYSLIKKIRVAFELIKFNLKFARWLKSNNVDVVYANDARAIAYIGVGTKLKKVPLVWYVKGVWRTGILFRIGLILSDKIILIAESIKKAFTTKELERYERKMGMLYLGFDFGPINSNDKNLLKREVGIPQSCQIVGLVGSINPNKGYHILIESATHILAQNPNVHFLLVGDVPEGYDSYYKELLNRIDKLGLTSYFHWTGFVRDVNRYYSMMDVLVLPSYSEGLPGVLIEGLFYGLPVVATDVGGVREIIVDDVLGSVIDVGNASQLADEIIKYLSCDNNENKKKRHEYVVNKFALNNYVSGFESIVQDLVSNKKLLK